MLEFAALVIEKLMPSPEALVDFVVSNELFPLPY